MPLPSVGAGDGREQSATTTGRIDSPSAGERVPMVITASGSATGLVRGHQLWVLVQFLPSGPYFPAAVVQDGDRWAAADLYVGGPGQAGQDFLLHLADFGPAAQQKLDIYFEQERRAAGCGRDLADRAGRMGRVPTGRGPGFALPLTARRADRGYQEPP